jgi:hypothetical protein
LFAMGKIGPELHLGWGGGGEVSLYPELPFETETAFPVSFPT